MTTGRDFLAVIVLMVAAERWELNGVLRHCSNTRTLAAGAVFARAGDWNRDRVLVAAHGPGPRLAAHATRTCLQLQPCDAVVSIGLCGALNPAYRAGDIFVATSLGGAVLPVPDTTRPFQRGRLYSTDRVLTTASEKRACRDLGDAVDMEAAGVAAVAVQWRVPFYCVRVVSDEAGESLPLNFNDMVDSDGRFSRTRILGAALSRPFTALPDLFRLGRLARRAALILGDFLVTCRF